MGPVSNQPRVAVFCKAPAPGYAKTRLIPRLGTDGAARLHAALAERTLKSAIDARIGLVELWCAPDVDDKFFRHCRDMFHVPLIAQPSGDLGARLNHCVRTLLVDAPFVILIGTDCPELDADYLCGAATSLLNGHEAVIGPALDGGYVLLGLSRCPPEFFDCVPWSSAEVLRVTRERLRTAGLAWQELKPCLDIDTPEDFDDWQAGNRSVAAGETRQHERP